MKIVYFAWLREKTGRAEEELSPPDSVTDVLGLIEWLRSQGAGHVAAFADLGPVRVAVNQEYVALDYPVGPDDEVAFFPPVTGG